MTDDLETGNFPDYHEHDDFQPAMLALSHLVVQWNWAEHNLNVLLWQYVGDFNTGSMYTAGLGNQSRTDALINLARMKEEDLGIIEIIEFSIKAFERIKNNRNALVHAHSVSYDRDQEDKPRWIRGSKNPKNIHLYCFADISDITSNLNAACSLALLLNELIAYYASPLRPKPSLEKFDLPDALVPHPVARIFSGTSAPPTE